MKVVHPAGLPPADSPFEAEDDNNFTTDAKKAIEHRVHSNLTIPFRNQTGVVYIGGRPQGHDAKAELNRRGQACEVLADTGVRVAKWPGMRIDFYIV
jgi:hypothetical protein